MGVICGYQQRGGEECAADGMRLQGFAGRAFAAWGRGLLCVDMRVGLRDG